MTEIITINGKRYHLTPDIRIVRDRFRPDRLQRKLVPEAGGDAVWQDVPVVRVARSARDTVG